jgi:HSP20 family protein
MNNSTGLEARKATGVEKAADKKQVPAFIEAEKMFEKVAEITKDIAQRAFEFFRERGGEFGKDVEDWFKAESELLRPVPIEMTESDAEIFVTAAVPGFKAEEIEISVKDDVLIVSGKTETDEESEDASTIVREWTSNRFYRQLTLPSRIFPDKANAKLVDGLLKLTLPKAATNDVTKVAVTSA